MGKLEEAAHGRNARKYPARRASPRHARSKWQKSTPAASIIARRERPAQRAAVISKSGYNPLKCLFQNASGKYKAASLKISSRLSCDEPLIIHLGILGTASSHRRRRTS